MVTLRTYLNPFQAALDKTLLDSHKVFCYIADENANLYGGGPFAMPVRLLVADEQAEEADRILKNNNQPSTKDQRSAVDTFSANPAKEEMQEEQASNNPWELLAMASLFFFPGVCLLLQKQPVWMLLRGRFRGAVLSIALIHSVGWLAIAVALSLAVLYFYTQRSIARDEKAAAFKPS